MSGASERETFPSNKVLTMGFEPGDSVAIGGLSYGIDVEAKALVMSDGRTVSLADGATTEVAPGLFARATTRPDLGTLAIAFWGRGDLPIVRQRGGTGMER